MTQRQLGKRVEDTGGPAADKCLRMVIGACNEIGYIVDTQHLWIPFIIFW